MSSAASEAVVRRVWESSKLGLLECGSQPCQTHLLYHAREYLYLDLCPADDVQNIVILFFSLLVYKVLQRPRFALAILVNCPNSLYSGLNDLVNHSFTLIC